MNSGRAGGPDDRDGDVGRRQVPVRGSRSSSWRDEKRIADIREPGEALIGEAERLLDGVRRLCVRRHYVFGEAIAALTTCPVISPWPGQEDKICGADLYPGFLLGDVGEDPLSTIRQLVGELRIVTAERDAALMAARSPDAGSRRD